MSADLLRRAAELIEQRAADSEPRQWHAWESNNAHGTPLVGVYDGTPTRKFGRVLFDGDHGTLGDARWVAMLSPQVASPLAALLRAAAEDFEIVEATNARAATQPRGQAHVFHSLWVGQAFILARAVLGEVSS